MWISATHKVRVISTEPRHDRPVIEIFRKSAEGWIHVKDTESVEELAKLVDLAGMLEIVEVTL